jgi:hypothetical protein
MPSTSLAPIAALDNVAPGADSGLGWVGLLPNPILLHPIASDNTTGRAEIRLFGQEIIRPRPLQPGGLFRPASVHRMAVGVACTMTKVRG